MGLGSVSPNIQQRKSLFKFDIMVPQEDPEHTVPDSPWIMPAKVHLSPKSTVSAATAATPPQRHRNGVWLGLGLLMAVLVGGSAWLVFSSRTAVSLLPGEVLDKAPGTAPSASHAPWSQTQQAKWRAESQPILAQLFELQKRLQAQGVESWAPAQYAAARQLAEAGDAAYRAQKFAEATASYQQALTQFQELQARSEQVFAQLLERGREALNKGAAEVASLAFQGALRLKPDHREAVQGRQRAEILAKVQALIANGDQLFHQGQLEEARSWYEQALQLDAKADTARTQLQRIDRQREVQKFRQAMSEGYGALAAHDLESAQQAFSRAKALDPTAGEARRALGQVEQRLVSQRITRLLAAARELEQSERWQAAAEKYRAALSLDPHLALAQQGKREAASRASLYARIQQTLAHPERLGDEEVYQEAADLLRQVQQLNPPGSKLSAQITALSGLLEQAATPVTVILRSDNKTEVTLYRVGKLGKFETKQVELRPGRYVAVGIRKGYRDARTEFVVAADEPSPLVVVQAEEQIPR
jgi:tetratricopeptide (TPR) repeat protein